MRLEKKPISFLLIVSILGCALMLGGCSDKNKNQQATEPLKEEIKTTIDSANENNSKEDNSAISVGGQQVTIDAEAVKKAFEQRNEKEDPTTSETIAVYK